MEKAYSQDMRIVMLYLYRDFWEHIHSQLEIYFEERLS